MIQAAILFAVYWVISRAGAVKKPLKWKKQDSNVEKKTGCICKSVFRACNVLILGQNFYLFIYVTVAIR